MTEFNQVQQHPASVDMYIRHGWSLVPIPQGTKGPRMHGWNRLENAITDQNDLLPGQGIGLAHAYSGTMALDVDHWRRAKNELLKHNIDLQSLYDAPDSVIIDSGREGHGKLLYRMPDGLVLPSQKLMDTDFMGARYNYLDFRCGTHNGLTVQDVLPPSIHPDTNQPYRWAGLGHWSRLPLIPDALLSFWKSLLEKGKEFSISSHDSIKVSIQEVQQAITFISPDISREEWISVGMALHYMGSQTGDFGTAFEIWDDWSKGSLAKYPGERAMLNQWTSFRIDKDNLIKLGSLLGLASQAGWVRQIEDVQSLFPVLPLIEEAEPSKPELPDPFTNAKSLSMPDLRKRRVPRVKLSDWPDVLSQRSQEVAKAVGCDPLIPLFAGLAAVCGAINAETRLELISGFRVPPILWLMTIGEPADKKSPGSRPMLAPLKTLEQESRPEYMKQCLEWEAKEAMYAATKKAFLEFAASPESLLSPESAPQVAELPPQPVPMKITVSDITSQKLVRHASERPRGLLCYLDEMNAWVRKITDKNSGEDRSAWVSAYEGEPYDMDRVGAGSIHCDNLAVAIYGNIQPKIHQQARSLLSADGLLQRFIPGVVDPNATQLGYPVPEFMTSAVKWEQTLRVIYAMPAMIYQLDDGAYVAFREFQQWYEEKKRDERLLRCPDTYMTAFGKLEGLVGRLALVFHAIETPMLPTIRIDTMIRVIQITKEYIIPSLRLTLADIEETTIDQWLADYVIGTNDDILEFGRIKRSARRQLEDIHYSQANRLIVEGMDILEQNQWVRRVEGELKGPLPKIKWAVNPQVRILFRDKRSEIENAKKRRKSE